MIGLLGGLVAAACIVFVVPSIEIDDGVPLKIGWPWYGLITCISTFGVGRIAQRVGGVPAS